MIVITHYDDCRDTIQLVYASALYGRETRAEYRARLLPFAQAHAARCVDQPEFIDWQWWTTDGYALDSACDEIYQIVRLPLSRSWQRSSCPDDISIRVVSEAQAIDRIDKRRAWIADMANRPPRTNRGKPKDDGA